MYRNFPILKLEFKRDRTDFEGAPHSKEPKGLYQKYCKNNDTLSR